MSFIIYSMSHKCCYVSSLVFIFVLQPKDTVRQLQCVTKLLLRFITGIYTRACKSMDSNPKDGSLVHYLQCVAKVMQRVLAGLFGPICTGNCYNSQRV